MANINMSSIMYKLKKYTESDEFKKRITAKTDEIILHGGGSSGSGSSLTITGASGAAGKFIEVLQEEIRSLEATSGFADGKLGSTAVSALEKLEHGTPVKVGENQYQIEVWFGDSGADSDKYLQRDSLAPDEFDGINNIAALLNNGYKDHGKMMTNNPVYGVWMGHSGSFNIPALRQRSGAYFIQNAIRNYMENYAAEYGVIDIKVDDIYE